MFYAHFVLAKKGPLAKIWLAAHWDRKLTKAHVFETNIEHSVEGIMQPKVKIALRTSGHLLLGIVRIYSRKAKYLLADCNEAFIKIKMAFRPGVVDLPENNREANVAAITLREVFHDFDSAIPDITLEMDAPVNLNQSRAEDITLKEDYSSLTLMADDAFDMAFDEPEAARDASNIDEGFHASLLLGDETKERGEETEMAETHTNNSASKVVDASLKNDGFGNTLGEGLLDAETGSLFEPAGLFDDAPLDHVSLEEHTHTNVEKPDVCEDKRNEDESDDDMYDMGPASMGAPSPASSAESPRTHASVHESGIFNEDRLDLADEPFLPPGGNTGAHTSLSGDIPGVLSDLDPSGPASALPFDHHKLMHGDSESFALGPLDASIVEGCSERMVKAKRKRKLIVDEVKSISGEEMKLQLSDTSDVIISLDLAPPTKRLMYWKETGGVEKLFSLPGAIILSKTLSKAYQMHLTTRSVENENFGRDEDLIDLDADLEQARDRDETETSISRKRRREEDPIIPPEPHLDALPPCSDGLNHSSFEANFLHQQHHLFPSNPSPQIPEPEMMSNVMSVMPHPQAHVIQQMLQPNMNEFSHIPQMMHPSMVDQGLQNAINPIHNSHTPHPPVVPETYNQGMHQQVMEPVSQHLLADTMPQISDHPHPSEIDKQMPTLTHPPSDERLEPSLQNQLIQSDDQMSRTENYLNNTEEERERERATIFEPHVDDEVTQPAEEYLDLPMHTSRNKNVPSESSDTILHNEASNLKDMENENFVENHTQNMLPESSGEQCNAANLFDSLNNGEPSTHTQNNNMQMQDHNDDQQQKSNDPCQLSDDDDYGAPASVGPALPEQQMDDETYEQFEERILVKRTTHMLHSIHIHLDRDEHVKFGELVKCNKRKQVAQKFYTFLVLKKLEAVELEHNRTGDLLITKGLKYNAVYNGL